MAGIRPGFVIIAINHKKVANVEDFNNAINDPAAKGRVLILAKQGNYTRFYSLRFE
jgi:serine protease Do